MQKKCGRRYRKGAAVGLSMILLVLFCQPVLAVGGGDYNPFNEVYAMLDELGSQVDDLNALISGKADADHDHDASYYTKPHVDGEIDGLQGQLDDVNAELNGKADASHDHDDAYYSKAEVDDKIEDVENQMTSPNTDRLISEFTVGLGESINAGDVVGLYNGKVYGCEKFGPTSAFNDGNAQKIKTIPLSDSKFVIIYQDCSNNNYGTARVGIVSGKTITYGSEYIFNSAATSEMSAAAISESKFVVVYKEDSSSNGVAVIGDVSGNTISFGSGNVFHSGVGSVSIAALSSTRVVIAFADSTYYYLGKALIGEISDNGITFGTKSGFNSYVNSNEPITSSLSICTLSSSQFVVIYKDYYYYYAAYPQNSLTVGSVDNTGTITFGSEYSFYYTSSSGFSVTALSSAKIAVVYPYSSYQVGIRGGMQIGTISGNAVSFGSTYYLSLTQVGLVSAISISNSLFVVTYQDPSNSSRGAAVQCEVSGTVISTGSRFLFTSSAMGDFFAVPLSSTRYAIAFCSDGSGSAIVGKVIGGVNEIPIMGISMESKTAGLAARVIIDGVSDVHSGLVSGSVYYLDRSQGFLTTQATTYRIGLAISSTKLILADPFF